MKTRNTMIAAALVIAAGCAKEIPSEVNNSVQGIRTIEVNMPEMTKTALGDATETGVSVVWSEGDEIAVGDGTTYSVFKLVGEGGSASGVFELKEDQTEPETVTEVVFPASASETKEVPTDQTYVDGSFDPSAMVMSWTKTGDDENIILKHKASALMLTVSGTEEQLISSVDVACGEKTYKLKCEEPVALTSEGKVFYIAVPGSDIEQEYKFTINAIKGGDMCKSATHTLAAGKIGRLPKLTFTQFHNLSAGDYFGGGIVFDVAEKHVKIVSLDEFKGNWATANTTEATSNLGTEENPDEGIENTNILKTKTLANLPALKWCIEHGDGWYMPSRRELSSMINGLRLKQNITETNAILAEYGGAAFQDGTYYWSCCENGNSNAWAVKNNSESHYQAAKKGTRPARAIKKIELSGGEIADPKPSADEVVTSKLAPTKDAQYTNSSTTKYQHSGPLRISYSSDGANRYAAYFCFDLSTVNAETFKSASIHLTLEGQTTFATDKNGDLTIYSVSNEWQELDTDGATKIAGVWQSSSKENPSPTITTYTCRSGDNTIVADLTTFIRESLAKSETTVSVCIQSNSSSTSSTKLFVYPRESTVEGTQPYLEVKSTK